MLNACAPAAPATNPGARALYLGAAVPKRVSCTEQALVVTNARAQTWRYPLARVARVVSSPAVDWTGAALALCLRNGISIAWTGTRGDTLGVSLPARRGESSVANALEVLMESPQGRQRYDNWLRCRRMATLKQWAQESPDGFSPQRWEDRKREWVYAGEYTEHLPAWLRSLCMGYVASQMHHSGIPAVLWDADARRADIDEDLCNLVWADMNLRSGNLADSGEGERPLTELFERWAGRNAGTLLAHLHALERLALRGLYE
jgi:hypothetical protein